MQIDLSDISKKLVSAISFPRLMPTEVCMSMMQAAQQMGLRIFKRDSVFFGKSLAKAFKAAIDAGSEFILTIDYDTPHERNDILTLYGIMKVNPEIDAVCALQMKRDSRETLISVRDKTTGEIASMFDGADFTGNTVPIAAGNFGLTILRTSSLLKVSKPWFMWIPDENGEPGENSVDEDIAFWRKWEAAGLSLHCAHIVPVAHLEWHMTWPGLDFTPVHQSIADYQKSGMPASVRRIE